MGRMHVALRINDDTSSRARPPTPLCFQVYLVASLVRRECGQPHLESLAARPVHPSKPRSLDLDHPEAHELPGVTWPETLLIEEPDAA